MPRLTLGTRETELSIASAVPRYRRLSAFIAYNSKARLPQFLTN
jgi:hypothetical protein